VRNDRDVISTAVEVAGATFVDPLGEGWYVDQPGVIGVDGAHPTVAGHASWPPGSSLSPVGRWDFEKSAASP
jgi:hypothetical protein